MTTRFQEVIAARDWDWHGGDRRRRDLSRPPSSGGRCSSSSNGDATIANMRASADTGVKYVTPTVLGHPRRSPLPCSVSLSRAATIDPEAFPDGGSSISPSRRRQSGHCLCHVRSRRHRCSVSRARRRDTSGGSRRPFGTWSASRRHTPLSTERELPSFGAELAEHRPPQRWPRLRRRRPIVPYLRATFDLGDDVRGTIRRQLCIG